ncbi:hypothetical protein F5876DRAFT_27274, partial [Lentinula aff. lateritia]
ITHISDFILEDCGFLKLSPTEIVKQQRLSKEPLPPVQQLHLWPLKLEWRKLGRRKKQLVKDAIQIFDIKYPNDTAVFVFDCSSTHESFAKDALRANKMNRNPGGQQPKMHDTIIP